jgi:hypothetical protein
LDRYGNVNLVPDLEPHGHPHSDADLVSHGDSDQHPNA